MHKRTKSTGIPRIVKKAVAERDSINDWPCCISCGKPAPAENKLAFSNAHYIPRSLGGLGIEENILTLCPECHREYDFGTRHNIMKKYFSGWLMDCYPGWDEEKLIYRKE